MNNLVNGWDRFLDFDHDPVTEAGKVENYRLLENCSIDSNENQDDGYFLIIFHLNFLYQLI